ncbi:MAG TPA: SAM-dependent methyltransferase, partial [Tepidiformaceae bacterium]|nr:SAM-dependent methyltransferase [Tepidiformaceae bacterium]
MTAGPIHIVGLGPGAPGHLTVATRDLIARGLPLILRTRHHPTVAGLAGAFTDCDDLYAGAESFDHVYEAVAARVLEAAESGEVVYAVPGHPLGAQPGRQPAGLGS